MIINLPWVEPINTQKLPENLEELVKKSFREFTKGTRKEYQHEDKLLYLDNLRKVYLREDNTEKAVRNIVSGETMYYLEEYGEMPNTEDILSVDFMETCYKEGFRPFYDHYDEVSANRNSEALSVILNIIKIVVNYEEAEKC